jgi:hypothetical protein
VIYTTYKPEELPQEVVDIFASFNCHPPTNGFILVGYEGSEIICFQAFHQVNHAGPVWIKPEHRGKGLWAPLQQEMEAKLAPGTHFYQFGTRENVTQLRRMGLTALNWTVWEKKV